MNIERPEEVLDFYESGQRFVLVEGCMFASKTSWLVNLRRTLVDAGHSVLVVKHSLDDRYDGGFYLSSHDESNLCPAVPVAEPVDILQSLSPEFTAVLVDEAQFFSPKIVNVVRQIRDKGLLVVAAGLDTDFRREPFGSMHALKLLAECVVTLTANCVVCGGIATLTQRLINGKPADYKSPVIAVGATNMYQARCVNCHELPGRP